MVNRATHNDYIKLYKELVEEMNHKEDMIEQMTQYIAKYAKKNYNMCKNNETTKCNYKKCEKCVRKYFEERGNKN